MREEEKGGEGSRREAQPRRREREGGERRGERKGERWKRQTKGRGKTATNHDAYPLPHPSRQRPRYGQPATLWMKKRNALKHIILQVVIRIRIAEFAAILVFEDIFIY